MQKQDPLKWGNWSQTTGIAEAVMNKQRRAEKTASTEPLHNTPQFLIASSQSSKIMSLSFENPDKETVLYTEKGLCVYVCVAGASWGVVYTFQECQDLRCNAKVTEIWIMFHGGVSNSKCKKKRVNTRGEMVKLF